VEEEEGQIFRKTKKYFRMKRFHFCLEEREREEKKDEGEASVLVVGEGGASGRRKLFIFGI
jgi:hypothetical protein